MKTLKLNEAKKPFSKLIIFMMLLCYVCVMIPSSIKGQSPACYYLVHNSTECTIVVTVSFYDDCVNNTICSSSTQTITSNNNAYFNCSPGCYPAYPCNVRVTLDYVAASAYIGVSVDANNVQNNYIYGTSPCGSDPSVNLDWGSSSTLISVGP